MSAITTWTFSQTGHGNVCAFTYEYGEAGGFAIVGFSTSDSPTSFQIFNLGNSQVAILAMLTADDGNQYANYWNSHYGTSEDGRNNGMITWYSNPGTGNVDFASNSIGAEQTFVLENGGSGNIALRATAGAFGGQYLCGMQGGWYPDQSSGFGADLGTGSFFSTQKQYLQIQGDQLPILIIASSGYQLDLHGKTLPAIDISRFDMTGCNLAGANLTHLTNWAATQFIGATLDHAVLTGMWLNGPTWNKSTFKGSDLRDVGDARNCTMEGVVFDGANLSGLHFDNSDLRGASFIQATLSGTTFKDAHLEGAHFDGATVDGASFEGAHMQGTSFNGCDLSTTTFGPAPDFTRAATGRTTFENATVPFDMIGNNWSWLDLTGAKITKLPKGIVELIADGALLPDGLDLGNMDLRGASFLGTRMYGVNLQGANLEGARLMKARLKQAILRAANLTNANLDSAWLIAEESAARSRARSKTRAQIVADFEPATLHGAFMFNTVLDAAHCDGVDFSDAYFLTAPTLGVRQSASAIGAYMNQAGFTNAWLVQTTFNGAQLSAANFSDAHLVGARFQDYDGAATLLTTESGDTPTRATVANADIRGTDFTGANMDGLEMGDATYSTSPGSFSQTFTGYDNQQVPVAFNFGPTLLGNTTVNTTCPNDESGPCTLSAGAPAAAAGGAQAAASR